MTNDQGSPLPQAPAPAWDLPEIRDVKIHLADYQPRKARNFDAQIKRVKDAIEIVVTLESPLPIRAMGPVLYVGNTQLTESEAVDKEGKRMRFWAFDREMLSDGAPISLGWPGSQGEGRKTKFTFQKSW